MSEKYTKGPWNANFTRFSRWVVGFHITDPKHGSLRPICEMGAMNPDEIAANARLISAAPELLEALKWAVDNPNDDAYWIEQARAAIAKATGEQA